MHTLAHYPGLSTHSANVYRGLITCKTAVQGVGSAPLPAAKVKPAADFRNRGDGTPQENQQLGPQDHNGAFPHNLVPLCLLTL